MAPELHHRVCQWSCCGPIVKRCSVVVRLIRRHPHVLAVPLVVLVLALGLGLWGLNVAERKLLDQNRQTLTQAAASATQALQNDIYQAFLPGVLLGKLVQKNPNVAQFNNTWNQVIDSLWASAPRGALAVSATPLGRLQMNYIGPSSLWMANPVGPASLGADYTALDSPYRPVILGAIAARGVSMQGPYPITDTLQVMSFALPVFISGVAANETWGLGKDFTACPPGLCYNSTTRTKVWGIVGLTLDSTTWFRTSGPILAIMKAGKRVLITRNGYPQIGEPDAVSVYSSPDAGAPPDSAVQLPVQAMNQQWRISVWNEEDWAPNFTPVYAALVIGTVIICGLLFAMLLAWAENKALLYSLLPKDTISRMREEAEWDTPQDAAIASIQLETPARHMLAIISACLEQQLPRVPILLAVRDALYRTVDPYRPTVADFKDKLKESPGVDAEVRQALVAQLLGDTSDSASETSDMAISAGVELSNTVHDLQLAGKAPPGAVRSSSHKALRPPALAEVRLDTASMCRSSRLTPLGDALSTATLEQPPGAGQNMQGLVEALSAMEPGSTQQLHAALNALMANPGALLPGFDDCVAVRSCSHMSESSQQVPQGSGASNLEVSQMMLDTLPSHPAIAIPDKPLWTQLEVILGGVNTWAFDSFALEEASCGHPLSVLGYYLISQTGLAHWANMDVAKLIRFLQAVEDGYPVTNPYHNKRHAAEVLQAVHMIVTQGGLTPGFVDEGSQLACYLSAIIHDFEHRGRNNDYLVNAHDELAVRYNDKSPMENHHLAAAWGLLRKPELNCLSDVPKATWLKLRKLIIDLVLATDMKQHFAILGQFETMHQVSTNTADKPSPPPPPRSSANGSQVKQTSLSGTQLTVQPPSQLPHIVPISDNDRTLSLQMALKCADLANLAAPLHVYLRWVRCLEEELFQQGDDERAQGLALSPLCDRTKAGVSKSQSGFFTFVACPLFKAYTSRFTDAMPMMQSLLSNLKYWQVMSSPSEDSKKSNEDTSNHSPRISSNQDNSNSRLKSILSRHGSTHAAPAVPAQSASGATLTRDTPP